MYLHIFTYSEETVEQSYPTEGPRGWDISHWLQPSLMEGHRWNNCPVLPMSSFLESEHGHCVDFGECYKYGLGDTRISYTPCWCPKLQLDPLLQPDKQKVQFYQFPIPGIHQLCPKLLGELSQLSGILPTWTFLDPGLCSLLRGVRSNILSARVQHLASSIGLSFFSHIFQWKVISSLSELPLSRVSPGWMAGWELSPDWPPTDGPISPLGQIHPT